MSPELTTRHFDALGSTCELLSVDSGQAALERCEQRIRDAEARFTRFLRDSELAGLNASDGRYVPVSPEMFAMLHAALWAFQESGGLVNAAVLPALAAAGYDRPFRQGLTEPSVLRQAQLPPLPEVLLLDQATRSAALAPGAGLDLGGIAKGALADILIDELGDNAVCNLGGDLRIRGAGPEGDGWHIGLCDGTLVALRDGAVCTSGISKRRWGHSMHHLIDPRTGIPAKTDLAEVSVVTDSALRGEVYAKSAVLLGAALGTAFLEARGVHYAVVPAEAAGEGAGPGALPVAA
ncbi:MAG: FAD:protein FMN transferase [Candidatus Dormibacteraeota bacterium]|nr:FAD:protein FMN transferase [Candidatus Dormibacteraeota bacterium]